MRLHDGERKKRRGFGNDGLAHRLERMQRGLGQDLGGKRAAFVATETVGQHHQHGVVAFRAHDAILVGGAATGQAVVGKLVFHVSCSMAGARPCAPAGRLWTALVRWRSADS